MSDRMTTITVDELLGCAEARAFRDTALELLRAVPATHGDSRRDRAAIRPGLRRRRVARCLPGDCDRPQPSRCAHDGGRDL